MARTTPVNSGYKIINGTATGSNASIVDVWLEWKQLSTDIDKNQSQVRVLLYAQCTGSSSTSWTVADKFGYVSCDGTAQYRSTTYNFANNAVNCFGDYTFTVSHNTDGSKSVTLAGAFTTKSSYVSGGSVSSKVTLSTIPRASTFGTITGTTLGGTMRVNISRASNNFTNKVWYQIGDGWSQPFVGNDYVNIDLPISLAEESPKSKELGLLLWLETYNGTTKVGSEVTKTVTVSIPENDQTKPTVTMKLSPVSPIEGLFIQNFSKVQAAISAEGKLGADVEGYSLTVNGNSYGDPYLSGYLTQSKEIQVIGSATDSRGITGTTEQTITVLPYYRPRLTGVKAYRCTSEGIPAENGEYLKIKATRDYAKVVTEDGAQHNFCTISYRYKTEGAGGYSEDVEILAADAEENSVETGALLNATLSKEIGYFVQIVATDTVGQKTGQETVATISIPNEHVFRHKRAGGKGLGFGGYCAEDDMLDVHWNARIRKSLQVDGGINGIYESTEYPGCRYRIVDEEMEWLNPPMMEGVEYRTAERCDGNAVYAIRVSVAELPNSTYTTVKLGVTIKRVVEFVGICFTSSNNQVTFPIFASSGEFNALAYINSLGQLYIKTTADMRTNSAHFTVKYTKK